MRPSAQLGFSHASPRPAARPRPSALAHGAPRLHGDVARKEDVASSPDGCHRLELGADGTQRVFYACFPVLAFPFDVGASLTRTQHEHGVAVLLEDEEMSLMLQRGGWEVPIDGIEGHMEALSGCEAHRDPCGGLRAPARAVLALDASGSMAGDPLRYRKEGLALMLDARRPEDDVTPVTYSSEAGVVFDGLSVAQHRAEIERAIAGLEARGNTNLYDGLFTALHLADERHLPGAQTRVMLLFDGRVTAGIRERARFPSFVGAYAERGMRLRDAELRACLKIPQDVA